MTAKIISKLLATNDRPSTATASQVMSPSTMPPMKAGTPAVPRPITRARMAAIAGPGEAAATRMAKAKIVSAVSVIVCSLCGLSSHRTGPAATLGGIALFVMALGMGAPLIIVGVLARSALPKTGPWMENVKRAFGVMLLAVAVWLVSPVLPGIATMLAWAAILVVSAIYLHALDPLPPHASGWQRFWKGWGVIALLAGAAMFIGALAGSRDPLQPLAILRAQAATAPAAETKFQRVRSVAELDQILKTATRPVMLDFYADWCISCKEMERFTFADPAVARRLASFQLIQADVTANNDDDKALLKRFNLFGPPGIIFFDATGAERKALRVVGFQEAEIFGKVLDSALKNPPQNPL